MFLIPTPRRAVTLFAAVLVMSSLMTISAFADAPFRIESLTGEVTLERENAAPVAVRAGMSLGPGDVLRTGEGAAAVLVTASGARFTLAPDTEIALDDLSLDEEEDSPAPLRLILGVVNAVVDAAAWNRDGGDGSKDVVHTPTAVIGVRGTAFDVAVSLDGATAVAVDEGGVELDPDAGAAKSTTLRQGQAAELDPETGSVTSDAFTPRSGRDWGGWRKRRENRLAAALPVWVPRLRQRFDRAAAMAEQRTADLHSAMDELGEEIERIRTPPAQGRAALRDRKRGRQMATRIMAFRARLVAWRRIVNRLGNAEYQSRGLENFTRRNAARFTPAETEAILADLTALRDRAKRLGSERRFVNHRVREIHSELREWRAPRDDGRRSK